ncbi:hypothetical protein PM082_005336 [Marasmius tenuissimus]|nr:hypothetical protein PM082_005336 [Marasmius tenuissimus]
MACRNCRKRKIKCVTNEDPPHNPCERCTRKGLHCEYVAVGDETPPSSPNAPSHSSPHSIPRDYTYYPLQHPQATSLNSTLQGNGVPGVPRSLNPSNTGYGGSPPYSNSSGQYPYGMIQSQNQNQSWSQQYGASLHLQSPYTGYSASSQHPQGSLAGQNYQPVMYGHDQRSFSCMCNGPCVCGLRVHG